MIENSGDPVFMVDDETARMIYVNEAAKNHYGAEYDEIYTWIIPDWDPKFSHENYKEELKPFFKMKHIIIESLHQVKDGKVIPVEITVNKIIYKDKSRHYGFIKNIEERKNMENALKKLLSDKDRFIRILGHDLRNPFNSLLGFSGMLLKGLRQYNIDKIEKQVKIINTIAERTYTLLDELLLWSKSQSGQLAFKPRNHLVSEICAEVLDSFIENTKTIEIIYLETEAIYAFTDLNMFKTILRNLISNAIKFTNRGGKVHIYSEKRKNEIIITISDNGIGISKADIEKIWDFTQIYTRTGTADEQGTGLGLLLCKEFVEKHGGKIWVESEEGQGSDFKFSIPVKKQLTINSSIQKI